MASSISNSGIYAGLPAVPPCPGAEPERIVMDAFRLAIADQVHRTLQMDIGRVYEALQIGAKTNDCSLPIPRFRLKEDAKAVAKKVAEEFVPNDFIARAESGGTPFVSFFFHTPTLNRLVLHQINELNYLQTPAPSSATSQGSVKEKEKEVDAAPAVPAGVAAGSTSTTKQENISPVASAPGAGVERGYGTNTSGAGKKVLLDFSSPNIAKPFHAGHLRSTIIGMFCANIYAACGWKTTKMNYLGDWGKQYGILAVGFEKYGSEEELLADPIKHLYNVYVKINDDAREETKNLIEEERKRLLLEAEKTGTKATILDDKKVPTELTETLEVQRSEKEWADAQSTIHGSARALFRRMEDQEPEALAIWKRFRDLSIVKYKEIYARLNIDFDIYWGESQVSPKAQDDAVEDLKRRNLVHTDQGALLCQINKKLGKVLIRKRDGTALYMTRDIGGAKERYDDYQFDKSIYVVANQQELHFQQLFEICKLLEYPWAKDLLHVGFGMVAGMSTRKGTVVFLEDILNEAKTVMHEQMASNEEKYAQIEDPDYTADVVGITAVKVQDMAGKRGNNYDFNWKRMTSFEGDTGPYLQYAHVRLASVERKSAPEVVLPPYAERNSAIDTDLLTEPKAREIIYLLASYPDVIKKAQETLEPSNIITFLFRLCHAISSAWEVLHVRGQTKELALARLWLFVSARDVLASAMKILSLTPLDRM